MACFVAPMAEAIVVTIIKKTIEKKERKAIEAGLSPKDYHPEAPSTVAWSRKLGWLNKMLWGGVLLLALEHLWHGEIVPWPPFLTAVNSPADIGPVLFEIATVGSAMAIFVTVVWAVMVVIADRKAKTVPAEAGSNA